MSDKYLNQSDNMSFQWLAQNYIIKKSLRNWTWLAIIQGIIDENLKVIELQDEVGDLDATHVSLLWHTLLEVAGVSNLDRVPLLKHPKHNDVKAVMIMYSLDSFLFERLNKCSRDKDNSVIATLGPYAVALTTVINGI